MRSGRWQEGADNGSAPFAFLTITSHASSHTSSPPSVRVPSAAAGGPQLEHIAWLELATTLCGQRLAVEQVLATRAVTCPVRAARRAGAALGEQRDGAALQHAVAADDTIAATMRALPAGAAPHL